MWWCQGSGACTQAGDAASPCSDANHHAPLLCRIRDHGQCAGLHCLLPGTEPWWAPCLVDFWQQRAGFPRGKRLQVPNPDGCNLCCNACHACMHAIWKPERPNALFFSTHSDKEATLLAELDAWGPPDHQPSAADVDSFPYAAACFQEGLRLFPPASAAVREAPEGGMQLGGFNVPAGTAVQVGSLG